MKGIVLVLLSFAALMTAHAEDINAKLACKGTTWVDGKKAENNQGFISIANGLVTISGMLTANGLYKVQIATVREDHIDFKSVNNQLLHGSINRITGEVVVFENDKNQPTKSSQALFLGICNKAKQLF